MGFGDLGIEVVNLAFDLGSPDLEQGGFGADGFEVLVDHVVLAGHLRQLDLVV